MQHISHLNEIPLKVLSQADPSEDKHRDLLTPEGPHRKITKWRAFAAFMQRSWFSRGWVIQEASVARAIVLICGPYKIAWPHIFHVSSFLMFNSWREFLEAITFQMFDSEEHFRNGTSDPAANLSYTSRNTFILPAWIQVTRQFVAQGITPHLSAGLAHARMAETTDARDKVFAVLGFCGGNPSEKVSQESLESRAIVQYQFPDYTRSVEDVYIQATRFTIQNRGNLDVLCGIEDISDRRFPGLPSWVPDYSVTRRSGFDLTEQGDYHADAGFQKAVRLLHNERLLSITGAYLD